MTSGQRVPGEQNDVRAFLAAAGSGCGDWLNSVLVALGDKVGLYKTGQYSSEKDNDSRDSLRPPVSAG